MANKKKIKIGLACSASGHLTELLQLEEIWKNNNRNYFFVSDKRSNAIDISKKEKVYFVVCPRRNPLKLVLNFVQAFFIFLREQPDVVISTGADTAIPFCLISHWFGKKIIFIESFARINEPSKSGKIIYKKADLFFVQWEENKRFFPEGIYDGALL